MAGRLIPTRAEPGVTLPAFERVAPPPPPDAVAATIEAHTGAGDLVADLHGRGGWIARAAIDRQRRAVTIESSPLNRLLAELVLRPPDLRHLDAAFQTLSASPRGESSLRLSIGSTFATACATCGRTLAAEEFGWEAGELVRRTYRCTVCRDQQAGPELRHGPPEAVDLERAAAVDAGPARARLRERFPVPEGGADLVTAILDLHTDRQLDGLAAILERIEGDLRAAPVEAGLRLAFLHAILPASRLAAGPGRAAAIRIAGGQVRTAIPDPFRERNPWLAFEDGFRAVRAFVQHLEAGAHGAPEARIAADLRGLVEGSGTAVIRLAGPGTITALAAEVRDHHRDRDLGRDSQRPRIRLIVGQPPLRSSQERLASAYHGTAWALGREAAQLLPLDALLGPAIRAPWAWQAAALRRSLASAAPTLAPDGRVVLLLDGGGPEAVAAAALGGVAAGYRVPEARLADPDDDIGGVVHLIPPGAALPPGPRTRANQPLGPVSGGPGDPELIPGPGLFAPPERPDARPFSAAEAGRAITELAVEVLRERGEPARFERLFGELLVGLDRSGHLRRLVAAGPPPAPDDAADVGDGAVRPAGSPTGGPAPVAGAGPSPDRDRPGGTGTVTRTVTADAVPDPVERLVALVRDELGRPSQGRLAEIEPGRWWLADRRDRDSAAVPLADRVEWSVYSLLSTAGPLPERAFFERIASLFPGHDLPDEALVRACLDAYRAPGAPAEALVTGEDLRRRTVEHTELLALLANGGHRLGMSVWLGRREQARRIGSRLLGDYLEERERTAWLSAITRAPTEDIEAVDCIWYVRGRTAVAFELEWTAMLGELMLRRHARIAPDPQLVRIAVLAPERAELASHKLEASPVLRAAVEEGNWHLMLWPALRAWLTGDRPDLDGLEPYLGLAPAAGRRGEQLGLFDRPDALP